MHPELIVTSLAYNDPLPGPKQAPNQDTGLTFSLANHSVRRSQVLSPCRREGKQDAREYMVSPSLLSRDQATEPLSPSRCIRSVLLDLHCAFLAWLVGFGRPAEVPSQMLSAWRNRLAERVRFRSTPVVPSTRNQLPQASLPFPYLSLPCLRFHEPIRPFQPSETGNIRTDVTLYNRIWKDKYNPK